MMIDRREVMDNITHEITGLDAELYCHIPELARRKCTPRVMAEVDALLDRRNEFVEIGRTILAESVEEFVYSDEFEYLTNGGM